MCDCFPPKLFSLSFYILLTWHFLFLCRLDGASCWCTLTGSSRSSHFLFSVGWRGVDFSKYRSSPLIVGDLWHQLKFVVFALQDAGISRPLTVRRRDASLVHKVIPFDERMIPYLLQSGFAGVSKLPFIQLDWALLTALVEHWRPETHTFHLPHDKMTITL